MRSKVLADAMIERGIPEHIRSGNGPEFVAQDLREWLAAVGAKTLYIEPGSARIGGALPTSRHEPPSVDPCLGDSFASKRLQGVGGRVRRYCTRLSMSSPVIFLS